MQINWLLLYMEENQGIQFKYFKETSTDLYWTSTCHEDCMTFHMSILDKTNIQDLTILCSFYQYVKIYPCCITRNIVVQVMRNKNIGLLYESLSVRRFKYSKKTTAKT